MAIRTAAPADPGDLAEDQDEELAGEESGRGLTRGVVSAGLAVAVALVIITYWDGITPRIPGIAGFLGLAAGFVIVMAVFWAAATVLSLLLRWHHRDIASWTYTRGKQGVTWGYGHGRHHGGRLWGWLSTWAAARWQARQGGGGEGQDPPPGPARTSRRRASRQPGRSRSGELLLGPGGRPPPLARGQPPGGDRPGPAQQHQRQGVRGVPVPARRRPRHGHRGVLPWPRHPHRGRNRRRACHH